MNSPVIKLYSLIRLPGIVVHEISHLLLVILIPGIEVESVDLTSEVEHSGQYTGFRMFLISYAPLYVNASLAYVLVSYSPFVPLAKPLSIVVSGISILLSFSLLVGMVPSYVDAVNPVRMAYRNLKANPISVVPFYMPFILAISLPFIIITRIFRDRLVISILFETGVAVLALLLFSGVVDPYNVHEIIRSLDLGVFQRFLSLSESLQVIHLLLPLV